MLYIAKLIYKGLVMTMWEYKNKYVGKPAELAALLIAPALLSLYGVLPVEHFVCLAIIYKSATNYAFSNHIEIISMQRIKRAIEEFFFAHIPAIGGNVLRGLIRPRIKRNDYLEKYDDLIKSIKDAHAEKLEEMHKNYKTDV